MICRDSVPVHCGALWIVGSRLHEPNGRRRVSFTSGLVYTGLVYMAHKVRTMVTNRLHWEWFPVSDPGDARSYNTSSNGCYNELSLVSSEPHASHLKMQCPAHSLHQKATHTVSAALVLHLMVLPGPGWRCTGFSCSGAESAPDGQRCTACFCSGFEESDLLQLQRL